MLIFMYFIRLSIDITSSAVYIVKKCKRSDVVNTKNLTLGGTGRPKGAKSARPTAKQVDSYRRDLHAQAADGNTLALFGIVMIDTIERQQANQ